QARRHAEGARRQIRLSGKDRPRPVSTFLQQLVNGLSLGSIYALIALGYTMVYGILRLINFAHGDVYMVGAYVGYYASLRYRGETPSYGRALGIMVLSMAVCAILGIVI